MISKTKCKIAFIGAGYMATEHLKVFNDIDNVELSGICSRTRLDAEKLAKEFNIQFVCNSVEELYLKTKADAVVIAVPELSAKQVAFEIFRFPWVSLFEKPVGYNPGDALEILNEAKRHSSQVYVALNRRHYSSTTSVLNDLSDLNGHRLITIYDQEDTVAALAAGQPELVVKNWMFANSIHLIDLFYLFSRGDVVNVEHLLKWDENQPFAVMAKLTFDSGDIGLYQALWNAPGPWGVTISTFDKRFELRPLEVSRFQKKGERTSTEYEVQEWDNKFKPGLRKQAGLLVEALLNDSNPKLSTLEDAYKSMSLINRIYFNE